MAKRSLKQEQNIAFWPNVWKARMCLNMTENFSAKALNFWLDNQTILQIGIYVYL